MQKEKKVCSVEGCENPVRAKGLCSLHYTRLRRHGDPLGGRTLQGAPLRFYREVVLTHETDECLIWPFGRNSGGYAQLKVQEQGKTKRVKRYVSRLACAEVYGPPPSETYEAAHSCGRGSDGCVNPRHLYWATREENAADKQDHGTWGVKLSAADVKEIRELPEEVPYRNIAQRLGITEKQVGRIRRGETWAWVEGAIRLGTARGARHGNSKLSEESALAIHALKGSGRTRKEVGDLFGVSPACVGHVWKGTRWGWLTGENP